MADPTAQVVVSATDRTQAAFRSADRGMRQLQRSAMGIKSALASVGVILSARMFASWIKGALDAKNMTVQQLEATKEARAAIEQMKKSTDDLARSLGTSLAPVMRSVAQIAIGLNAVLFNADPSPLGKEIADIQEKIDEIKEHAIDTGIGELLYSKEQQARLAQLSADLQKLKTEQLDRILDPNRFKAGGGLEELDVGAIRDKQISAADPGFMRSMPGFDPNKPSEATLKRAAEITDGLKTELDKQLEQWHEAQTLFSQGLISDDTVQRMQDSLLEPIEVTAKRMKGSNEERLADLMETFKTENQLEIERYAQRLEGLQQLYGAEMVQREEFMVLKEELEQEHQDRMTQIASDAADEQLRNTQKHQTDTVSSIVSGLVEATAALASNSKRMFDLNKKFAKAEALINAYRAIQQVWADPTLPFYAKIAATAITAVKTAANISAINAATFGGGTTPSAAGGATVNNVPVASDAIITVRGINKNDLFTGREIIEMINQATKDGAKLVLEH